MTTTREPAAPAQTDDPVLDEMVRRLVDAVHPDRIILFGSRARGDARPDSDYDLLLIAPSALSRGDRSIPLFRALRGIPVPIDVIWRTQPEVDEWLGAKSYYTTRAVREGRVVYERAA